MASSAWQVGLGLASVAATYPITRWYDKTHGVDSRKRKLSLVGESAPVTKKRRVSRFRPMARSRFRRRRRRVIRRRRRVPFRRRRFTKKVQRVILKTAEAKHLDAVVNASGFTTREGNGTTRSTYVFCPTNQLQVGPSADEMIGSKVWLRGITFRGQAALSGEVTTFAGAVVRVSLVFSKFNMETNFTTWTEFTSLTTPTTNPTQTPPFANPQFFEATGTLGHVGNGNVIPFDRTKVKLLGTKWFTINPGAENQAGAGIVAIPTIFKLHFPINRWFQFQDPSEASIVGSVGGKYGNYYLVMQVISNTNSVANTVNAEFDYSMRLHYRDP